MEVVGGVRHAGVIEAGRIRHGPAGPRHFVLVTSRHMVQHHVYVDSATVTACEICLYVNSYLR